MTDIIIPVLNEEKILTEEEEYYLNLKQKTRLIFVDGGSSDRTVEVAKNYGDVIKAKRGRSLQMNEGAAHSQASNMLFLHVDTFINDACLLEMNQALNNGVDGGCFTMKIQENGKIFRIFENIVNFRAKRFGVIDGDLGVFVKKSMFEKVGSYDQLPIMEDILFSQKMKKAGKCAALDSTICVSGRKWRKEGFIKTLGKYVLAYIQLWTKIPIFRFQK